MPKIKELQARITELEAAQKRANAFFEVSRGLTQAKNAAQLLDVVAKPAIDAGVDKAVLYYFDLMKANQPQWAEIVASIDNSGATYADFPIGTRFHLPEFPFAALFFARQDEPLLIADVATDERLDDNERSLLTDTGTLSWVVIPLTQTGQWLGNIQFIWSTPHDFSDIEMDFYRNLASLVAPVVDNQRLLSQSEQIIADRVSELRRKVDGQKSPGKRKRYKSELHEYRRHLEALVRSRTHRLEALADFTEKLSSTLNLDSLLELLVTQTQQRFGYYHVHVYLTEITASHEEMLILQAGAGEAGRIMKENKHQIPLNASTSLVARAAREQTILFIHDVWQEPTWLPNKLLPDTRSEIAVPIILEGRTVGVFDVQSDKVSGFDEGDATLLGSLSSQVAAAMRNVGLYTHAKQRAKILHQEIKERKLVEEALRQNEFRYRLIAENVTDLISQVTLDGHYKYVSVSCEAMLGYKPYELIGRKFNALIHPVDLDHMGDEGNLPLTDKLADVRTRTYRLKHKSGHYIWVEATSRLIRDSEDDTPVEFISVSRDITERKLANEELRTFKTLVENATDGIYVTDLEGNIIYANSTFLADLGYDSTLIGQSAADLIAAESETQFDEVKRITLEQRAWRGQLPHKRADDSLASIESSAFTIVGENDTPIALALINHDISEREETAKALMESEKKFYSLYVSMNEALALYEMIYDENKRPIDYRFVDINPTFETIMELKWEDVVGRKATEVYGLDRVPYLNTYSWVANSGETTSFEVTLSPVDKVCRISVFSPGIGQFATIIQDISQRKMMEQRMANYNRILEDDVAERTRTLTETLDHLQSTQAQLVESEKMAALGSLVAGVAHEINTPIGIGVSMASLLNHETEKIVAMVKSGKMKISALKEYLQTAQESSALILNNLNRAAELVQSFKRVAVDQTSLDQRAFQVRPYIQETLLSLKHAFKRSNHVVETFGDNKITMSSYPGAFAQIVSNFVLNSLKHAYEEGDTGHMRFDISEQDDWLTLVYQDDGLGIPPENVAKIFEPFFTTARSTGGSGLGLHIVYNLVTQTLGGTIRCESEIGKGTKFTLKLPLTVSDDEGHPQNESPVD